MSDATISVLLKCLMFLLGWASWDLIKYLKRRRKRAQAVDIDWAYVLFHWKSGEVVPVRFLGCLKGLFIYRKGEMLRPYRFDINDPGGRRTPAELKNISAWMGKVIAAIERPGDQTGEGKGMNDFDMDQVLADYIHDTGIEHTDLFPGAGPSDDYDQRYWADDPQTRDKITNAQMKMRSDMVVGNLPGLMCNSILSETDIANELLQPNKKGEEHDKI